MKITDEKTVLDLKKIFLKHGLEFYIRKQKGNVVKVNFLVKDGK